MLLVVSCEDGVGVKIILGFESSNCVLISASVLAVVRIYFDGEDGEVTMAK